MKVIYQEIEINYQESSDDWHFTLRGRERTAKSLKAAKEAIDKPAPKKTKPFERFDVWYSGRYGFDPEFKTATVTSIVVGRYGREECRVNCDGKIETVDASKVYTKSKKNDELVARILAINHEIAKMEKERDKLMKIMTPAKIEPEDSDEDRPC